jgi:2EXR family
MLILLRASYLSANDPMTLHQMINQLSLAQAHPQPEFRQSIPQTFWPSFTMASQEINKRQPVAAEFHPFPRLPAELRRLIWWFALPAQRPLEINIRINNERKDNCVWAVGPFPMLKVCQQSRQIALSVYEPRLELYTSREKPERVLCACPNTISRPEGHVFIYMRKGHAPIDIQPDSEVHSVVAWEDIPLGFRKMQVVSPEFVVIKYFRNWPPEENEDLIFAKFRKDRYEECKDKLLPLRLQNLSLWNSVDRMRRRHKIDTARSGS